METTTAFDLNKAIQRWRDDFAQSPAFSCENLDELEVHLRDSVACLQGKGLSAEESFIIAARRIGEHRKLEAEFGRANSNSVWLDRVLWMLVGIQVWGLASGLISSIARNAFAFGWRNASHNWQAGGMALPVTLFTLVQVMAFAASIGFCWWVILRKGGALWARFAPRLQRRSAFIGICVALCMLAFFINVFSSGLSALLFWAYGKDVVGQAMLYSSYSQLWVSPFQIAAMIAATLVLARKRFRLTQA